MWSVFMLLELLPLFTSVFHAAETLTALLQTPFRRCMEHTFWRRWNPLDTAGTLSRLYGTIPRQNEKIAAAPMRSNIHAVWIMRNVPHGGSKMQFAPFCAVQELLPPK